MKLTGTVTVETSVEIEINAEHCSLHCNYYKGIYGCDLFNEFLPEAGKRCAECIKTFGGAE